MQVLKGMFWYNLHNATAQKQIKWDVAILELDKLQAKVIKVFGEEAADKEIVSQIQNLIVSLKLE